MSETTDLVEKFLERRSQLDTTAGLLLAQSICQRRLLEAFDKKSTWIVLAIMGDIIKAIEQLKREENDSIE